MKRLIGFKVRIKKTGEWFRSYGRGVTQQEEHAHVYHVDFFKLLTDGSPYWFYKDAHVLKPVYEEVS